MFDTMENDFQTKQNKYLTPTLAIEPTQLLFPGKLIFVASLLSIISNEPLYTACSSFNWRCGRVSFIFC